MNKKLLSLVAILFLVALFFGINIIAQNMFRNTRLDLTADKLFTLSEGARAIARSIDEPVKLTFYFSSKGAVDKPAYLSMAKRVREVIEEFGRESKGKIVVKVVNPEPYSDEEEQAVKDELDPIPLTTAGDAMFFGLVGTNSTNGKQVIPQFDPRNERMLEYDLAKLVYSLKNAKKKKIGVMTTLGLQTYAINPQTQQPMPKSKWQVFQQLAEAFEIEEIQTTATAIPDGVDVLVVVHPKKLSDQTLYAIDQFLMRGGRMMAFVDPLCQTDDSIQARNQMEMMMADRSSNLNKLLNAWGIEVSDTMVLLDNKYAPRQQMQEGNGIVEVATLPFAMLKGDAITRDDEISRALQSVNLFFAGSIKRKADYKGDSALTIVPLLESSDDSMMIEKGQVQFTQDMKQLLNLFNSQNAKNTIAARLTGKVKSAFPDGPPKAADGPAPDASKHLKESKEPVNILLAADVDMLNDRAWGQEVQIGRQRAFMPAASNGLYFVGGIENLTGSSELLSIRPRAAAARPFERVEEIKRSAAKESAAKAKIAEDKVRQVTQRMNESLRKREPRADGTVEWTPADAKALEEVKTELYAAQKEQRQIVREQNKDIDRLGLNLRVINIALVPALVAFLAVGVGVYRANRRSSVGRSTQN